MSGNLSKKILQKAHKNLKSPLDEEGQPLPLVVKIPLARETENKRKEKFMRNISPEDAKTTSEVLDRVLQIKLDTDAPKDISVPVVKHCVLILKALLALYQPQSYRAKDDPLG